MRQITWAKEKIFPTSLTPKATAPWANLEHYFEKVRNRRENALNIYVRGQFDFLTGMWDLLEFVKFHL